MFEGHAASPPVKPPAKTMSLALEDVIGLRSAQLPDPKGKSGKFSLFAVPLGLASPYEAAQLIFDQTSETPRDITAQQRALGVQRAVQAVLDSAPQMYIQLAAVTVEGYRTHAPRGIGPFGHTLVFASVVLSFASLCFGLTSFLVSPSMEKAACRVRDDLCRELVVVAGICAHIGADAMLRAVTLCTVFAALSAQAIVSNVTLVGVALLLYLKPSRVFIYSLLLSLKSVLYGHWECNCYSLSMCCVSFVGQSKAREKRLKTRGTLRVYLDKAFEVEASDFGGTSDPYVILTLGEQRRQSRVQKKTIDPVWNEYFEFQGLLNDFVMDAVGLKLEVYDEDMLGGDDPIGMATVDMGDALMRKRGPQADDYLNSKQYHRGLTLWYWWACGPLEYIGHYQQGNLVFTISWKPERVTKRFHQLEADEAEEGMLKTLKVPPVWKRTVRWILDFALRQLMAICAPPVIVGDAFSPAKLRQDMLRPTLTCLAAVIFVLGPWVGIFGWVPHHHLEIEAVELALSLAFFAASAKVATFFWCFQPAITGAYKVKGLHLALGLGVLGIGGAGAASATPLAAGVARSDVEEGHHHHHHHQGGGEESEEESDEEESNEDEVPPMRPGGATPPPRPGGPNMPPPPGPGGGDDAQSESSSHAWVPEDEEEESEEEGEEEEEEDEEDDSEEHGNHNA